MTDFEKQLRDKAEQFIKLGPDECVEYEYEDAVSTLKLLDTLAACQEELENERNSWRGAHGAKEAMKKLWKESQPELSDVKAELRMSVACGQRLKEELAASQKERDVLRLEKHYNWECIELHFKARIEKLEGALQKIADHDTLDGDKYVSYGAAWDGVAAFAREALKP